jgi:hypothetical protein
MFDENLQHSLEDVMRRWSVKHRYLTTLALEYEEFLITSDLWVSGDLDFATSVRLTCIDFIWI